MHQQLPLHRRLLHIDDALCIDDVHSSTIQLSMRGWQGTIQLLTHQRVRECARAADLVLLWPAVTNTCSSTTSRQCHQAYDHSSPPLLAASLRCCERRSLLAAPSSLPRFAAPIASSPRRPSSPLPPASASLAILHRAAPASPSSAGPRWSRPPPLARAGLAKVRRSAPV